MRIPGSSWEFPSAIKTTVLAVLWSAAAWAEPVSRELGSHVAYWNDEKSNGLVLVSLVLLLGVWMAIIKWADLPAFLLPTPLAVGQKLVSMLSDGSLWTHAWVTLYEVLLGSSQGPRFGSFIALYGVPETRALIARGLAGELVGS